MPLVNTEIWYAKKMRQENITAQQAAINVYKRSLVKDIKSAYYLYYQAMKSVEIYEAQLQLVNQNIRMNESLLKNGVRNRTSLTRAQSEQQKAFSAITQAKNIQKNARAYFNFLLNKPLSSEIMIDSSLVQLPVIETAMDTSKVRNRDELKQINRVENIAVLQQKMQESYLVPKLNTFLDVGSQNYNFNVSNKSFYYLFGIGLQWDIFSFGQKKAKIQQAKTDVANLEAQYNQTEAALQLELTTAYNNYQSALSVYQSALTDVALAEKYYRDQLRVYQEGQLLYIELLDAQNELTGARIQLNISKAQALTRIAEIERAEASYPLQKSDK
jgi:outer membrane protein TolC